MMADADRRAVTPREQELAREAQLSIATKYAEQITLEDIASGLQISVFHLCRLFNRVLRTTVWKEIHALRVRAAIRLLASGPQDLTTVALSLGFAHHSHFTAAFRRAVGVTPSDAMRIFRCGSIRRASALLDY